MAWLKVMGTWVTVTKHQNLPSTFNPNGVQREPQALVSQGLGLGTPVYGTWGPWE